MKSLTTTVTSKGQVTIPIEIRKMLNVKPHDRVRFRVEKGEVKIDRASMTLEETFGSVGPKTRTQDFERMIREAKEEQAARTIRKM